MVSSLAPLVWRAADLTRAREIRQLPALIRGRETARQAGGRALTRRVTRIVVAGASDSRRPAKQRARLC